MLNSMRGAVSGWTAKILLGLLVVSFAVWGIGDVFRGGSPDAVLKAGKVDVSLDDYTLAYLRARNAVAQQLGQLPTPEQMQMFGIDQSVLSRLMIDAIIENQGRRLGLGLSQERLAQVIASDPTFHDQAGKFSRSNFQNALSRAGISETAYIANQSDAAIRGQIVDAVSQGITPPKTLDRAIGLYNGTRRTIDYLVMTPDTIPPVADPSPDALKKYFAENKAKYAAPEHRTIDYAVVSPAAMADPSSVTQDQVAERYQREKARFTTPEKRHIEQIVFPDDKAAKAAKAKLDSGANFEEIAKAAGRSMSDIDLGVIAKDQIPDRKLADAAFALKDGEVSNVVDGSFGPALVKVTSIEPGSVQPLSDVSDQIRKDIALDRASEAASKAYNAFEDARAGGATFADGAREAGVPVKKSPKVDRSGDGTDGKPVDLPAKADLLEAAFQSEPGDDNLSINDQANGSVFYDTASVDPARDRPLDEVKQKVVADWKAQETQKRLKDKASFVRSEVASGDKTLDQAAGELGVKARSAPSITRQSGVADLGRAGVAAAFDGGTGSVSTAAGPQPGSEIVMKVAEIAPPADPASNVSGDERRQLASTLRGDLLQSYYDLLQNTTQVVTYPQGIEQAKSMVR